MNHQNKNKTQIRLHSLLKTLSTSTKFNPIPIKSTSEHPNQTSPILLGHLTISDISLPIWSSPTSKDPPKRLPSPLSTSLLSDPFTLSHLRWISQKTLLSQDICLISSSASCPYTRKLVLGFCELSKREFEYIGIHRDLSENELKQSREISNEKLDSNHKKSKLEFIDSATVRAAKLGRILILDGLEKAERGILPLLNNLLENREMNLEDGTHIIHPDRYESLSRKGSLPSNFISASRSFQVICISLPVPPFTGYPLDPPFRSRFQARYIDSLGASLALASPFSSHPLWIKFKEVVMTIQLSNESRSSSLALASSLPTLPNFPIPTLLRLKTLLETFSVSDSIPSQELSNLIKLLHPRLSFLSSTTWELLNQHLQKAGLGSVENSVPEFDLDGGGLFGYKLVNLERISSYQARAHFESNRDYSNQKVQCLIKCGSSTLIPLNQAKSNLLTPSGTQILISPRFEYLFNLMAQIHTIDSDLTLLPKPNEQASASTTFLIQTFSQVFGYGPKPEESIHLYREMTGKELVMRRTVNEENQTGWAPSRLVKGAHFGALVEITGIDLIGSSVGTISGLLDGRALELWGGRRLVPFEQKDQSVDPLASMVNPSFRVICTATKSGMGTSNSGRVPEWMSNDELGNITMMIEMIGLSWKEEIELMKNVGLDESLIEKLMNFVKSYRELSNQGGKFKRLGTRGLLRICKRLKWFPEEEFKLGRMLRRLLLVEFLPKTERMDFERCLEIAEIQIGEEWDYLPPILSSDQRYLIFPEAQNLLLTSKDDDQQRLRLKECPIERELKDGQSDQGLIPEMSWFFENREQNGLIRDIGIDLMLMGHHLVLLGNQGVGKNKIIDRLLMLLGRPREYVQLHRDSTVQQLMFHTSVVDGTIRYLDSPLLRAVRHGRVLVVDEADKAPEHVTGALKSLSERGEMSLGDGRRIVKKAIKEDEIEIHEGFKMVLLANRPGYPFLGHQFLQVLGDGFVCYGIQNPDLESEIELVERLLFLENESERSEDEIRNQRSVFGESLDEQKMFVRRLVGVFHSLREGFENGMIRYPFSLRELLNLVRHLKSFPQDGLEVGMRNVFDFDLHQTDTIEKVNEALIKNGFKVQKFGIERIREMGEEMKIEDPIRVGREVKVFGDELGGEDDENGVEAEIGDGDGDGDGESWGGGVGSLDSSGMRGRIGSKKILRRTNVYDQRLNESNNPQINEEIRERAKALSREELEKKLKDLSMRMGEVSYYGYYYKPIEAHIPLLVDILENLEAREEERVWVKGQSDGEFDEQRLVDGLIGESAIYKRRVNHQPEPGRPQLKPKRIRFVFDISSSMYRFQADGRLDRSCQTAIMIMESFSRLKRPERYHWDMIGHAGDGPEIDLGYEAGGIQSQWKVVEKMRTFSQYAIAGDHTVEAIEKAVEKVAEVESDEAIVIAISDANFDRYGITSQVLKDAMNRKKSVKTGLIAIGEGSETVWLPKVLPQQAYRVKESSEIPIVLRSLLSHLLV
ncbi:AAA domain-containing protein [Melampsora americana]|nr:AAA domain-containing protein [Melampsora americana]